MEVSFIVLVLVLVNYNLCIGVFSVYVVCELCMFKINILM